MAFLWAVFATASVQQNGRDQETTSTSEGYYNKALNSISRRSSSLDPDDVKALVQLAALDIGKQRWEPAFLVLCRAIRAILQFPRRCQDKHGNSVLDSSFLRTILAAFAMDTILAARSDTTPQLRSQEVGLTLQHDESEADEWEQCSSRYDFSASIEGDVNLQNPLRSLSIFKHYVKLLSILNDSVCDLCPFKYDQVKLSGSLSKLRSWKSQLSRHCRYCPTTSSAEDGQKVLPAVANLHLTAEAVSRFVHGRRISTARLPSGLSRLESYLESGSVVRSTYRKVFSAAAWSGVLDFHEYSSALKFKGLQTQLSNWNDDGELDLYNVSMSDRFSYPDGTYNPSSDPGIEMLVVEARPEHPLAMDSAPEAQHPMTDGAFLGVLDEIMTDQNSYYTNLASTELQMPDQSISADANSTSFRIPHVEPMADHVYAGPKVESICDENSIDTLLKELSAEQYAFDWVDMEVQSM